uniref:hypothetical protein n=1 Tax=Amycolatopsis sp. CA-082387 TaxID=3239918 RepID=UPI003F492C9E
MNQPARFVNQVSRDRFRQPVVAGSDRMIAALYPPGMRDAPDPADDGFAPGGPDESAEPRVVSPDLVAATAGEPAQAPEPVGPAEDWLTAAGVPRVHWLVVHAHGVASMDLALSLQAMLQAAQVHVTVRTVDDYLGTSHEAAGRPRSTLRGFSCVLLVLPSAPPPRGQKPPWKTYAEIAELFRHQGLSAAEAFRPGAGLSQEAAVIQVFHREEDLDVPEVRTLIEAACDSHCYSEHAPDVPLGDVLRVFRAATARRKLTDEITGPMLIHWRNLRKWGIETLEQALQCKRFCDERRQALEHPGKPALYRPIPGIAKNRLELLLTDPEARPLVPADATDEERKEIMDLFRDNGARVVRVLIDDMIDAYPWFHRPAAKAGRKGAQQGFVDLYRTLQIVTTGSGS